jgi:hypothetical protein
MNGVSCVPDTGHIAARDLAGDSPIFDLRRRQKMKARIPVTSNRAATAPMTGFATDAFRGVVVLIRGVVVFICIACTGILRKKPISHGKKGHAEDALQSQWGKHCTLCRTNEKNGNLSSHARLKFGRISPAQPRDVRANVAGIAEREYPQALVSK